MRDGINWEPVLQNVKLSVRMSEIFIFIFFYLCKCPTCLPRVLCGLLMSRMEKAKMQKKQHWSRLDEVSLITRLIFWCT